MDVFDILTKRRDFADHLSSGYGLQMIGKDRLGYQSQQVGEIAEGQIDRGKMAIQALITTEDEDRSNDLIITEGIDTTSHQSNPVVLYSHGMTLLTLPIGKAEDESGKYTVERDPKALRATTYFSQSLPEAYELFGLAAEGILRGWSIGAVPIETQPRGPVDANGFGPMLVKRCELFEYSLTPTPDNRMALTEMVLKSTTGGKPMSEVLLKSFQPWLLPVPRFVAVSEGSPVAVVTNETPPPEKKPDDKTNGEYEKIEQKPEGTTNKGDPPPEEPKPDESKPDESKPEGEPDKYAEYPHGAVMLGNFHDRFMEMADYASAASKKLDSAPVKEYVAAAMERLEEECDTIKGIWKSEYSDFDEPGGKSDSDDEGEEKTEKVAKHLPAKLGRYLAAFRATFTKGYRADANLKAENARLESENDQLKKALDDSIKAYDKLKAGVRAARRGR